MLIRRTPIANLRRKFLLSKRRSKRLRTAKIKSKHYVRCRDVKIAVLRFLKQWYSAPLAETKCLLRKNTTYVRTVLRLYPKVCAFVPNAVYGSSANYATQYGYKDLFEQFDYTNKDSNVWDMYD